MPGIVSTSDALRSAIETAWAPSGKPIAWEGDAFVPEERGGAAGFLKVEVGQSSGEQACFGSPGTNKHRDHGEVCMKLHMPLGSLPGDADTLTETLRSIFKIGHLNNDVVVTDRYVLKAYRGGPGSRWMVHEVVVLYWSDYTE
jgi:hypothetical protein